MPTKFLFLYQCDEMMVQFPFQDEGDGGERLCCGMDFIIITSGFGC